MARDLFWLYAVGTVCGPYRRQHRVFGPMTMEEGVGRFGDGLSDDPNWYFVSYWTQPEGADSVPFCDTSPTREEFEKRARYLCVDPYYNTCHGSDSERELTAWFDEFAGAPPADKVQPFWWEHPAGGSRVDIHAAWAATVAIAKGA